MAFVARCSPGCSDVANEKGGAAAQNIGDGHTVYALLGHRWGANTIAVSYGNHDFDGATAAGRTDHDTTVWSIGFTHTLAEPRVELFAGYRNFDLDVQNVTGIEDVDMFQMGARVRF